jgi:hypothetical protein
MGKVSVNAGHRWVAWRTTRTHPHPTSASLRSALVCSSFVAILVERTPFVQHEVSGKCGGVCRRLELRRADVVSGESPWSDAGRGGQAGATTGH